MTKALHPSSHAPALRMLAKERQMTSLIEKEIISAGADFVFDKTNWVPLYFDRNYAVTSDCGKMTAYRAVTTKGQLLWLVFTPAKSHGYHALCADPVAAMEEAQRAWARRRAVRQDWASVERSARDLIFGRQKFDIRLEDAQASPLCTLGIEGFLAAIGMSRVKRISGRMAGLLMKIEPQMGFVIYEAMQRHRAAQLAPINAIAAE